MSGTAGKKIPINADRRSRGRSLREVLVLTIYNEQSRSTRKSKLLCALLSNNGCLDAQTAAEILGEDEPEILAELGSDGCRIEEENGVLHLTDRGSSLKPEFIVPFLKHPIKVQWKEETTSTNDDARVAAKQTDETVACLAERQTAGRGRMDRKWVSGGGMTVEMSMLLHPKKPALSAAGLSFAVGLAARDAAKAVSGLDVELKWPNDVMVDGRKLAGILIESTIENGIIADAVIGIGVNLNQPSFPEEVSGTATSILLETGRETDRAQLAAALMDAILDRSEAYFAGGMQAILPDYMEASSVLNRTVDVRTSDGVVTGVCTGFGLAGELHVRTGGEDRVFVANDVSVREAAHV